MNRYQYAARLREPSTWAALAVLASFFGPQYADPGLQQGIVTAGVSLSALLAAFIGEKKQ
ncbi:MAG: hypothetical protein ACYCVW_17025 [Rhodocyclaceae bacterium]